MLLEVMRVTSLFFIYFFLGGGGGGLGSDHLNFYEIFLATVLSILLQCTSDSVKWPALQKNSNQVVQILVNFHLHKCFHLCSLSHFFLLM